MKRFPILFLFVIISVSVSSQQLIETDSVAAVNNLNKSAGQYEIIADEYFNRKNYNEALENYEKALELRKKYILPFVNDVLQLYANIGNCYFLLEQYDDAIASQLEQLKILSVYPADEKIPVLYSNIVEALCRAERFEEAKDYLDKLAEFCASDNVPGFVKYTYYLNAGKYHCSRDEHQLALEYMLNAIAIGDTIDIGRSQSLYNSVADIYDEMDDYDSAIEYYQKHYDWESTDTVAQAQVSFYIGRCYREKGDNKRALIHLSNTYTILKHIEEYRFDVANACIEMSLIYFTLDDITEANRYAEEAFQYGRCDSIEEYPNYSEICYNAGLIKARMGRYDEALTYFDEAIRHYEKLYGKENAKIAETLQNKAAVYYDLEKEHDAIGYLSDVLNMERSIVDKSPEEVIPLMEKLYAVLEFKSEGSEFIIEYKQMADIILNTFLGLSELDYPTNVLIKLCDDISEIYRSQGDYSKSMEYTMKSFNLLNGK